MKKFFALRCFSGGGQRIPSHTLVLLKGAPHAAHAAEASPGDSRTARADASWRPRRRVRTAADPGDERRRTRARLGLSRVVRMVRRGGQRGVITSIAQGRLPGGVGGGGGGGRRRASDRRHRFPRLSHALRDDSLRTVFVAAARLLVKPRLEILEVGASSWPPVSAGKVLTQTNTRVLRLQGM